jgi:phage terminase Nu1 subunit (DNA packaging protein)
MTDAPDNSATAADLAAFWGISRQAVNALARRGVITRQGRGFRLADSTLRYCAHLRDLATGRGGESAIASATAERARLLKGQADAVEIKNAALRGETLPAAEVANRWASILRRVQVGVLAASSRCAGRLPHLTRHDVAEIDAELRAVLTELGRSADAVG